MTKKLLDRRMRTLCLAVVAAIGVGAAHPALAETEIEALKRELAEQRVLLQTLLAEREAQKAAAAKAPAAPPAAQAVAGTPAVTIYGVLDGGIEHITNVASGTGTKSLTRIPSVYPLRSSGRAIFIKRSQLPAMTVRCLSSRPV